VPASKAEQVLDALKVLLAPIPDAVAERNSALPEKVPAGGLIILRDGDPGEPEQALGGFGNTYYQHAVEVDVTPPSTTCSKGSGPHLRLTRPLAASPLA
jgi:hypothetical protein